MAKTESEDIFIKPKDCNLEMNRMRRLTTTDLQGDNKKLDSSIKAKK